MSVFFIAETYLQKPHGSLKPSLCLLNNVVFNVVLNNVVLKNLYFRIRLKYRKIKIFRKIIWWTETYLQKPQ